MYWLKNKYDKWGLLPRNCQSDYNLNLIKLKSYAGFDF